MRTSLKPAVIALLIAGVLPLTAQAVSLPLLADTHLTATNAGAASAVTVSNGINGLLRFNLNALPPVPSTQIAKATLFIYVKTVSAAGKLDVSPITSTWTENTVTTGTAPTVGPSLSTSATVSATDTNTYFAVDVTNLVKDWIDMPAANFGLALSPNILNPITLTLDSKESSTTSHPAYLDVALQGNGLTGATGAVGPAGPIGVTGAVGATGAVGPIGAAGLNGINGTNGINGNSILNGIGIPLVGTGVIGDFYIDTATNVIYGPKVLAGWPLIGTSLIGATGATGAIGPQGPIGLIGATGVAGAVGSQGSIGLIGATGVAGAVGPQGPIGLTGATGAAGAVGPQGPIGLTGATGAAGAVGSQGPIGLTGATGAAGAVGSQGPIGLTGATGTAGAVGSQGSIGLTGATGTAGAVGSQGPIGLTGGNRHGWYEW